MYVEDTVKRSRGLEQQEVKGEKSLMAAWARSGVWDRQCQSPQEILQLVLSLEDQVKLGSVEVRETYLVCWQQRARKVPEPSLNSGKIFTQSISFITKSSC